MCWAKLKLEVRQMIVWLQYAVIQSDASVERGPDGSINISSSIASLKRDLTVLGLA